jgi:hypothetical protein
MSQLQRGGIDAGVLQLAMFASLTLMSCAVHARSENVRMAGTAFAKWLLPAAENCYIFKT